MLSLLIGYMLIGIVLCWSKGIIALTKACVVKVLTWPVWARKD